MTMTDLSSAAQSVLNAFRAVPDLRDCPSIAAALRAAADQVVPLPRLPYDSCCDVYAAAIRADLLAIATELEKRND